jgi:hypothetical protein
VSPLERVVGVRKDIGEREAFCVFRKLKKLSKIMNFEQPSNPMAEEVSKQRALSDAELLQGGAEYKSDDKGNMRMEATENQISVAKKEMESDLASKDWGKEEEAFVSSLTDQEKEFYSHGQSTMESYKQMEPVLAKLSDEEKKVVMTAWSKPIQERRNHFFSTMPDADRRREIEKKSIEFFNKKHAPDIKEQLTPNNEKNEVGSAGKKDESKVEERLTLQNIENAMKNGQPLEVRVQRSSGQFESGWIVAKYNPEDGLATVLKDEKEGKVTRKFVPLAELRGWQKETSSEELAHQLQGIKDFEGLSRYIETINGIQGSQDFFGAKELSGIIERVRKGELRPTAITSTGGLRQKVMDLMAIEKHRNTIQNI